MGVQEAVISDDIDDETLMENIAGGDKEAFRVLAKRYTNLLYSVAFRMVSQRADAEDIVQESLLRIWSKAHLWRRDSGAAVSTWIYRVAYNLCVDQKRRAKIQTSSLDENMVEDDGGADKSLKDKERRLIVRDAIDALPERQRAALVLCHYQDMSNADAAQIMGTSVKAIEGLLVRARQALKQNLKDFEGVL